MCTKLIDQQRSLVLALRDDRVKLLGSREYTATGPHSLGAVLTEMGCPCGKGRQTVAHVIWDCELCSVASRRRNLLVPACTALGKALDRCEPVSRDHAESTIARRALDQGRRPAAYSSYIGSSPVSFTAEEAESAALAHVLGIVREPTDWFRPTTALARPLLQATLSMVAAAIHASKKTLQAAHIVSRRRTQLHRALEHVRYHTWTHLKPTGTPCRCCALPGSQVPGAHVRRSRRPVDGAKALRAVERREGQRVNGPARLESLRVYAQRSQAEASQHQIRAQRVGLTLYAASAHAAENVAAARAAAEAAVALAEEREASELHAAQALVAADHAVAAHRAAVILAANTARDYAAAAAEAHIQSTRHNTGKHFARWVDQTVTGLIRASQRAAVQGWKLIQAANAARATAAPRLTTAERRVLLGRRKRRRQADAAADDAIQHALWERAHVHAMALLASRPDATDLVSRARDAARKRRADVAALEPQQRAVRHAAIEADYTALRAASRTALQDFRARSDRRRQEALDTAARARASARAYRAAVIAARAQGEPRAVHVRRVILLLTGETTPRRARVRAAAAAAAANSGPIGTTGLL